VSASGGLLVSPWGFASFSVHVIHAMDLNNCIMPAGWPGMLIVMCAFLEIGAVSLGASVWAHRVPSGTL